MLPLAVEYYINSFSIITLRQVYLLFALLSTDLIALISFLFLAAHIQSYVTLVFLLGLDLVLVVISWGFSLHLTEANDSLKCLMSYHTFLETIMLLCLGSFHFTLASILSAILVPIHIYLCSRNFHRGAFAASLLTISYYIRNQFSTCYEGLYLDWQQVSVSEY